MLTQSRFNRSGFSLRQMSFPTSPVGQFASQPGFQFQQVFELLQKLTALIQASRAFTSGMGSFAGRQTQTIQSRPAASPSPSPAASPSPSPAAKPAPSPAAKPAPVQAEETLAELFARARRDPESIADEDRKRITNSGNRSFEEQFPARLNTGEGLNGF